MKRIKSPAEPAGNRKDSPGIYDGQHDGIIGRYPRTKSSGPPEKHFDKVKGM